jgi:SAM-dependent methyltransferase
MVDRPAVPVDPSNAEQLRAWDGEQGEYWVSHAQRFDEGVAGYHRRFLNAAAIKPDDHVLDIGCGTGQTTRDAARRASAGSVLGVDLSARMIEVARQVADREMLRNASFVQADAQVHPFADQDFDVAISRSGAMFFGDPLVAFTNIARALRAGGRLILLAWQPLARNEWIGAVATALAAGRDLPFPSTDAPGPFSMSDPAQVRKLLTGAGFTDPHFDSLTEQMYFGRDTDDAYQFVVGLAGWMLQGLDDDGRTRALNALRSDIRAHHGDRGVTYGSAAWLITANRAPDPERMRAARSCDAQR